MVTCTLSVQLWRAIDTHIPLDVSQHLNVFSLMILLCFVSTDFIVCYRITCLMSMLTFNKLSAIDRIDFKFVLNMKMQIYLWHKIRIHFCVQVGMCIIFNMKSVHSNTVWIILLSIKVETFCVFNIPSLQDITQTNLCFFFSVSTLFP